MNMDLKDCRIATLHTLLCCNDGVSIVINQVIDSLHEHLGVPMENFSFACGVYEGDRYQNVFVDDSLWHKDGTNNYLLEHFEEPAPGDLGERIEGRVADAKNALARFFEESRPDLLIAHNTGHPVNFVYSVALHRWYEECRKAGRKPPKYVIWWHDSHLERERFYHPNALIGRYLLEGLPGPHPDGLVFINRGQWEIARPYFEKLRDADPAVVDRLDRAHVVVPNTCDIPGDWIKDPDEKYFSPKMDEYNRDFMDAMGITGILKEKGKDFSEALILLQHTRVVPRKRIDHAIDFAFAMADKMKREGQEKVVFLLISGPTGDELSDDVKDLTDHLNSKRTERPDLDVHLIWGEDRILSKREIRDGVKYYDFAEVPGIVANYGGLGTYFSDVEGFGNNLLELLSLGVPPVVNRYPIYDTDIAIYGFQIPSTRDGEMTEEFIEGAYRLLTDLDHRREVIRENARLLAENLSHKKISDNLSDLVGRMSRT